MFFTFFKQLIFSVFKASKPGKSQTPSDILVYDIQQKNREDREAYVKLILGHSNFVFKSREGLVNEFSRTIKGYYLFLSFSVLALALVTSLFKKNRASLALIPLEFFELCILAETIRRRKVKKIIFFSAYEKDAVYITNYLKHDLKISVQLVPSPNPIGLFYKSAVCNIFTLTVPYQELEIQNLKKNWEVGNTVFWPPSGFNEVLKTMNRRTCKNVIGFVSSGNWLRKSLGHIESGKGYFEAEENIVQMLKTFIEDNNEVKILVSLHPLEKSTPDYLEKSVNYYQDKFGDKFQFFPLDKYTKYSPELYDIAVAAYSSAMFERLLAGYKVVFSQKGMDENFYLDPRLKRITFNNQASFTSGIRNILAMNEEDYFEHFELERYRIQDISVYRSSENQL